MNGKLHTAGAERLPERDSLAYGVPAAKPGTMFALAIGGGITVGPKQDREIFFGRNRPEVHVCVGEDDRKVSRQHGTIVHRDRHWWVTNNGRLPLRLPGSRLLFGEEEPVPLATGYTPLFVRGSGGREHLLELYVTGPEGSRPAPAHQALTEQPGRWRLTPEERLALIVLGQRYLLHEARPQPLPWKQAAEQLAELQPEVAWGPRRLEHMVAAVRARLSRHGVAGLTREEVGEPVGNALNDNLLRELLLSTTLVPTDLARLDEPF